MSTQIAGGRLSALKAQAETKYAEMEKLLEGGNEISKEESGRAAELKGELREIKANYQNLVEASTEAAELKAYLNDPAAAFNFGNGSKPDSVVEIGTDGKVTGLKGFDPSQLAAIATTTYNEAWHQYMEKGFHGMSIDAIKAMQEGSDSAGGFLVPEQMQQMLVSKQPTPTRMRQNVRTFTTGRDHLTFPKNLWSTDNIYTSPVKTTQTGEIPTSATTATQTDPTFGQARIQVYTRMVNGVLTKDLMEDNMFDLQQFLVDKYHEAADIIIDDRIINGTGIGTVIGMLANPGGSVGDQVMPGVINIGSSASGWADGILDMAFSVPEQYEENLKFVLNKTNTLRTISKLKDSQNRYLFATGQFGDTGVATARPKDLVGYPFLLSGLMPNIVDGSNAAVSNAFPVIFGDLTGYYFVERVGMSIQVLDQTKATLNQVELVGRLRFGGQPVEDWKILVGKVA